MLPRRIGLVARTPHISFAQLVRVAAALNVQVMRDLRPIWNISGSVIALDNANSIEPGIWPIFIEDSIPDNALGIHLTDHHQPYARVVRSPASMNGGTSVFTPFDSFAGL